MFRVARVGVAYLLMSEDNVRRVRLPHLLANTACPFDGEGSEEMTRGAFAAAARRDRRTK
jgi:hypothetical protein